MLNNNCRTLRHKGEYAFDNYISIPVQERIETLN